MKDKNPKVCVLMSTYNGEKYIQEQIDSILSQEGVDVKLVVRDDGSNDQTCDIIKGYKSVELIEEDNIGCEASFMELLHLKEHADFYAFADQDDVWEKDKLHVAISHLDKKYPSLYACNLMLIDRDGNLHGIMLNDKKIEYTRKMMSNYILYNMHGCVLVWNARLHSLLQEYKPKHKVAHDTWVNAVANLFGKVYLDSSPHINYRLHGNNVSGYSKTMISRFVKALKLYWGKNHRQQSIFAQELLNGYGRYIRQDDKLKLINSISLYKSSLKCKWYLLNSGLIKSRNFVDRCFWILTIIMNKY